MKLKSKTFKTNYGIVKVFEPIIKDNLDFNAIQTEIESLEQGFSGVCFLKYSDITQSNINKIIETYCIN